MLRNFLKRLLRNQRLELFLRGIYAEFQSEVKMANEASPVIPEIPEIGVLTARESQFKPFRLNLLVPALSSKHVFGGIATALKLFAAIGKGHENLRIILTDETTFAPVDNIDYRDWSILSLETQDQPGMCVVPAGDRYGKTLSVGQNDFFIATAWWTSLLAKSLQSKQAALYKLNDVKRYIYLIQDFEPGFYPWSSRYALAESTYMDTFGLIAVFNTSTLKNYFEEQGFKFQKSYCFEPALHEGLKPYLNKVATAKRKKRILVYGRPSTARNAFEVIILALMMWVNKTGSADWEFISVGELHKSIALGNGNVLSSMGKLSIDAYAEVLLSSYAGISLMISPHPSYPPLEMAVFGIKVITNKYRSKDLAHFSDNIKSIDYAAPELVCDALISLTSQFSETVQTSCDAIPDTFLFHNPFKTLSENLISDLYLDVTEPIKSVVLTTRNDMNTFSFFEYELPVDLVNMTGGGTDTFAAIANGHIQYLKDRIGIESDYDILEVGCGIGRDAIPLTKIISPQGSYVGIDIIKPSIDWCTANISRRHPNFSFIHFDVQDQLHNPSGKSLMKEHKLPCADASIDRIFLWSVFTHMFEKDIAHYLREFKRVLKQDGKILATCFIVDDEILKAARRVNLTPYDLKFEHPYADGCYVNDISVPAGAVAFTEVKLMELINKSGLKIVPPILTGQWWGKNDGGGYGQDAVILKL